MTVVAPATTTVELLRFSPMSARTRMFFDAMVHASAAAAIDVTVTDRYRGISDWLMVWGAGAPDRFAPIRQQLDAGQHVIAFDLAYWDKTRKVRVSIDGPHPQAWVMRQRWSSDRLEADRIHMAQAWHQDGHVIVAGIGTKATVQYGEAVVAHWEAARIAECRALGYTRILYRHKRHHGAIPDGTMRCSAAEIDEVLQGCALVVTWHSNVAVDAIRMGIPVVCQDGAAAAICSQTVSERSRPLSTETRDRFLSNLAWFQWGAHEATDCWGFLKEILA